MKATHRSSRQTNVPGISPSMIRVKMVGMLRKGNVSPMSADPLTLHVSSPSEPEALELIGELNTLLDGLYHPDDNHFSLDVDEVTAGRGAFLLARLDGRAVGCGGVRLLDDGRAEVKRMYVRPEARSRGIGRGILAWLEDEARSRGATALILEMGGDQPEARGLYTAFGMRAIPCWGEYVATIDNSVCLGKEL